MINTGEGVFDPIAPIRYTLAQLVPAKPLVVAAYCRGAMVGQAMIEVRDFENESESVATYVGELSLPEKGAGRSQTDCIRRIRIGTPTSGRAIGLSSRWSEVERTTRC